VGNGRPAYAREPQNGPPETARTTSASERSSGIATPDVESDPDPRPLSQRCRLTPASSLDPWLLPGAIDVPSSRRAPRAGDVPSAHRGAGPRRESVVLPPTTSDDDEASAAADSGRPGTAASPMVHLVHQRRSADRRASADRSRSADRRASADRSRSADRRASADRSRRRRASPRPCAPGDSCDVTSPPPTRAPRRRPMGSPRNERIAPCTSELRRRAVAQVWLTSTA